jgi:AAA ATPase domain
VSEAAVDARAPVNPYIAGSPVTGTEMFYGRGDVFDFIRRHLIGRHRNSPILLYGQRRTGKTSVLYQLHRELGPAYRCVFIDLHGLDLTGMGNFLFDIATSISRSLQREHQLTVPVPDDAVFLANPRSVFETAFLDAVWSVLGTDHLVLMLDEVVRLDEEVRAGRIEREVFDYLRHLMQHHARLNFVFSLGSNLEGMRRDYAYLFSVSLYHRISFLEPAAARDLITEPVREHYQVAPQAVAEIMRITSGHPYYTQLVCHCLFDLWSRSPKPVMTEADVGAVLSDAIELGSPNLTYIWEESTPEEQAVMAGMAAAMHGEARPVTLDDTREAWQAADVPLPARESNRAARSLTDREVLAASEVSAGSEAYSFSVDLQRLWLEQHKRLEWVKEDLADQAGQWKRSGELWPADAIPAADRGDIQIGKVTRPRRYLAIVAAAVAVAGYLVAAGIAHLAPFTATQGVPQSLIQLLPGDLPADPHECRAGSPPSAWRAPGLTLTVHCTDAGLPGGNINAYQMDNSTDSRAAWENFNAWWVFVPQSAAATCPPKAGVQGIQHINANLPREDQLTLECGTQNVNGRSVPAMALFYPANDAAFVVAQGAPGSSLAALVSWWNTYSLPAHGTQPAPRSSASAVPPAALSINATGAIAYSCASEGALHSVESPHEVSFTFVNNSPVPVQIIFLGTGGQRDTIATLPAGEEFGTFPDIGTVWLVATDSGGCLALYYVDADGQVDIQLVR